MLEDGSDQKKSFASQGSALDQILTFSRGTTPTRRMPNSKLNCQYSSEPISAAVDKENTLAAQEYLQTQLPKPQKPKQDAKVSLDNHTEPQQQCIKILLDRTNTLGLDTGTVGCPELSAKCAEQHAVDEFLVAIEKKMDSLLETNQTYMNKGDVRSQYGSLQVRKHHNLYEFRGASEVSNKAKCDHQSVLKESGLPDLESYFGTYDLEYQTNDLNKFTYNPKSLDSEEPADAEDLANSHASRIMTKWSVVETLVRSLSSQLQVAHERNGELLLEIQTMNEKTKELNKLISAAPNHRRVLSSGSNFSLVNVSEDLQKEFKEEFRGRLPVGSKFSDYGITDGGKSPSVLPSRERGLHKHQMNKSSVPSILVSPPKAQDSLQQDGEEVFLGYNFTESVNPSAEKVEYQELRYAAGFPRTGIEGPISESNPGRLPMLEFESNMQQLHFNSTEDEGLTSLRHDRQPDFRHIGWTMNPEEGHDYDDEDVIPECVTIENRPSTELQSKLTLAGASVQDGLGPNSRRTYQTREPGYLSVDFNLNQHEFHSARDGQHSLEVLPHTGLIQGLSLRAESIGERDFELYQYAKPYGTHQEQDERRPEHGISIKGFESGELREVKFGECGRP